MQLPSNMTGFKPLPDELYIDKSERHGMGLFASRDLPANHDFGISHVPDKRFPDGYIRLPLGAFINHSDDPNCIEIDGEELSTIETIKPVKKGEEITITYRPWYAEEVLQTYN